VGLSIAKAIAIFQLTLMVASTAYIIYRRSMKQSEPEEAHSKSKQSQNYFARRSSPDFPLRLLFE
jgi:hypothetical protein